MRTIRPLVLAVAFSPVLASASSAADMRAWPPPQPPVLQQLFSQFYLRADFGYRFNRFSGGDAFTNALTTSTAPESLAFGGGVGARMQWFRADVTVDYGLPTSLSGTTVLGSPDVTAKLRNLTVLFNTYFDLGTWYGVTPYVGGGVGVSWLQASDVGAVLIPAGTAVTNPMTTNFSWAAIGGVAVPLTRDFLFDVSYRYLDLGTTRSSTGAGTVNYGDFRAHEIRVGLRYMLGG